MNNIMETCLVVRRDVADKPDKMSGLAVNLLGPSQQKLTGDHCNTHKKAVTLAFANRLYGSYDWFSC